MIFNDSIFSLMIWQQTLITIETAVKTIESALKVHGKCIESAFFFIENCEKLFHINAFSMIIQCFLLMIFNEFQ